MATKVIVNAIGQHIIADVKQVQNKETEEVVAYWVGQPRLVVYSQSKDEEGNPSGVTINFAEYCLVSAETEFTLRADNVVAILDPRAEVAEAYLSKVNPETDEPDTDAAENRTNADSAE